MSYNGSGTFLINTAGQPVVSGTVISSTAFNALTADLATGLSTAITKDGQTTVTANIPMANYKFTGLGAGSGAADSANLSQVQSTVVKLLASVSGTDTITAVGSPTVAAYAAGQMFYFVAAGDNTGAVTINIDSLGAKAVTRDGSVALAAGDIKSGEVVVIVYDGTRFQVVSQLNSSGDARFANVSIASALNVGGVATVTGGSVLNGGVVINEPGADVDFRVEGDTDANLVFVDASTDRIGVGTSTPGSKLDIQTSSNTFVTVNSTSTAGYSGYTFKNSGTSGRSYSIAVGGSGTSSPFANNFYFYDDTASAARMVLDASGNLGVGTTTPGAILETSKSVAASASPNYFVGFKMYNQSDGGTRILGANGVSAGLAAIDLTVEGTGSATDDGVIAFHTSVNAGALAERARISSGGVLCLNTTGTNAGNLQVTQYTGKTMFRMETVDSGTSTAIQFVKTSGGAAEVGSITTTTTATAYNINSDVRLKKNIVNAQDSGSDIDALQVRSFDWKVDDSHVKYGFIAQELVTVAPESVKVGDSGDEIETVWGVDYSKLVPMLVKEIQSLRARVAALEAK